jgi:DinB superfamily
MTSPDPVAEAAAYQRHLLDALGDDDPAAVQAETPAVIRDLLADAGDDLRTIPSPGEWSVLECVAHVVDAELVVSGRYRWILAQDEPELLGYDQDLWVTGLHHREDDPAILIGLFDGLRAANLDLWRRTPMEDRARIGLHRERGPESYDLTFRLAAGHDRIHLGQARATLIAVRRGAGDPPGVAPR